MSQLTEFQGKTEKSTAIVRNFTISLSIIDRSRQKINKHIEVLKNTINQLDLIEFHRKSYPQTAEYTSFQVYKYCLPKKTLFCAIKQVRINMKRFKSYRCMFSDHNIIRNK